uniref:Class II aldolase/adducin N-terminal domain-containing protein n=1 Tax=Aplanochytrium stocchinoi TaxID=215587 RepID=A0A7S3UY05_9STRA|mmetsp:Transcript_4178/g.4878  ORF Transcript_4178/g.4878 Transcript_4178/m.4878 type:complete len:425 (-) Transcript_4178:389-1663(-)|eukprot:CAMPEP_0204822042 /NCGR_PEP_ID=MMETSP1346-20131115/229_1 /ASSEMBLY_ACC=CAM_ASM_000771 /TAXON_ID=215587 /ORGANISM="Aplanochytrium stocchinoi, Strain GSBS06" /LENGTH=424 /DNA_ID=CAMNT_0051948051 /DNA_START=62 /DNA_END=1336 /DNA_ORIENTATION=-
MVRTPIREPDTGEPHVCMSFDGPRVCDGRCVSTDSIRKPHTSSREEANKSREHAPHVCIGFNGPKLCDGNCTSTSTSTTSPTRRHKNISNLNEKIEPHICIGFNGRQACDGNCISTGKKKSQREESLNGMIPFPSMGDEEVCCAELRQKVIDTCLAMNHMGINQGTSGNVSVRLDGPFFAITPSGVPYESLKPSMIVIMDTNDDPGYYGNLLPSSEWRIHYDIYRKFAEARAIVHAHSTYSTALSCCNEITEIPAFHYMVAVAGGKSISKAKYATFGSQELSDNVYEAMINPRRKACLMANHGLVAYGPNLDKALWLTNEVECLSKQFIQILSSGLDPQILSGNEMDTILAKFKSYGKQPVKGHNSNEKGASAVSTPILKCRDFPRLVDVEADIDEEVSTSEQAKKPGKSRRRRSNRKKRKIVT